MKLNNEQLKERLEEREVLNQHIEVYRHIIYEALESAKNQETRDRFENEQDYNEFMKSIEIERVLRKPVRRHEEAVRGGADLVG